MESVLTVLDNIQPQKPTRSSLAVALASPVALIGKAIEGLATGHSFWSFGFNVLLMLVGAGVIGAVLKGHSDASAKAKVPDPHVERAKEIMQRRLNDVRQLKPSAPN